MINKLRDHCHNMAKQKGFHDEDIPIPTSLMLIVSELGEALEAHRAGKNANISAYNDYLCLKGIESDMIDKEMFEKFMKDTFEDELADSVIRIFDLCGKHNIDIENHIIYKLAYNRTREHKHGKNY